MASMPSWIRRRFDSTESDSGAANCEEAPEEAMEASRKSTSRSLTPEMLSSASEGTCGGSASSSGRRLRTTSLSYESETNGRESSGSSFGGSKKVGTKVKTQWQKAVRKLSINSSGYSSSASSQTGETSPGGLISNTSSRTSMEKPGWALKQSASGGYQPRSRHLSINTDSYYTITINPIPEVEVDSMTAPNLATSLPPYPGGSGCHMIMKTTIGGNSPVPASPSPEPTHTPGRTPGAPSSRGRSLTPNHNRTTVTSGRRYTKSISEDYTSTHHDYDQQKEGAKTPSGTTASGSNPSSSGTDEENSEEDAGLKDEFPYGAAFKVAMGRTTHFPDGTEAVMIDSAKAHQAFQSDDQTTMVNRALKKGHKTAWPLAAVVTAFTRRVLCFHNYFCSYGHNASNDFRVM